MKACSKFVSALAEADQAALEHLHLYGPTARQRQRAHAVLLSAKGYGLDQLADILRSDRDTISGWLDQWQKRGLEGLADAPKSGRRRKIDDSLETLLRDILIENPSPNMKALLQAEIKKKTDTFPGTP
jgi:transposase